MLAKRFEEQVMKNPNKLAVKTTYDGLSYHQLNRWANRIAYGIYHNIYGDTCNPSDSINNEALEETASTLEMAEIKWEIKEEQQGKQVALLFEHGSHMIAGMMGALKANKIYVPLDPSYPESRLKYMLEDSEAHLIVTNDRNKELAERLMDGVSSVRLLNVDEIDDTVAVGNPQRRVDIKGNQIAYILYTSGSTGKPKGVIQSHENVIHFITNYIKDMGVTEDDRLSLFSAFSHDAAVMDIYSGLLGRATLYPLNIREEGNIEKLNDWLVEEGITIWHSVPTLYRYYINTLELKKKKPQLKTIVLGGEAVLKQDILNFQKYFEDANFINLYGQTESSYNSYFSISSKEPLTKLTIGQPVDDTEIYVVDEDGEEVDPLETGEIIVVSNHIALGYWRDREKTDKVFHEIEDVGRIYWTGDLGRLTRDEEIEFIGRKDHQVKIRGYRVELTEIEDCLLRQGLIKEAVVLAKEDHDGDKSLYGYITAEEKISPKEIREYIAKELPDYMAPSYVIQLEKMPLTPNGKLDRKALLKIEGRVINSEAYEAPRDEVEKALVPIWQEILKVEDIGINHNFFELGGHSLKATAMVGKIHREFDILLSLREVFKQPTIKAIAELIKKGKESSFKAIEAVEEREYYPTSPAQRRLYTLQQLDRGSLGYNMPGAIMLEGNLEVEKVEEAFNKLIQRHEALRTSFRMEEGEVVQYIEKEVDFQIQHRVLEEEKLQDIIKNFVQPFDLSRAPLFRAALVKMSPEKYLLMYDLHHIISDGTSMGILIRDFTEIFRGIEPSPLKIQYKDYSHWQNQLLTSGKIDEQKQYWLQQFEGEIPVLNLIGDVPRPAIQSFEGDRINHRLEVGLTNNLRNICKETGATLYMVILSALNILLAKYSRQDDIIVGSPIAGRPHGDLKDIMGMFVNTLAMRNYPRGERTFREFLEEVKKNSLEAYENQDYQFEELVENLNLKRDMSRNPLFDVMFTMQNMERTTMVIDGLKIEPYNLQRNTTKFDLTVSAMEIDDTINFIIEYATQIFKKETIQRLYRHLENILMQIAENTEAKLSEIQLVTKEEKQEIIEVFNNTITDYPRDKTIHQLFEDQVEKHPDKIAIVFEDSELTYQSLNERANQFARVLRKKGVKRGSIVGIMVDRSLEMMVGIMGILKAGGAYLPIDPDYPQDRINYMLEDSCTELLLTQSYHKEKISFNGEVIDLNDGSILKEDTSNLDHINTCDDLAYVIYTSGSTGKPKGNLTMHYNVVRLLKNSNYIEITPQDTVLQLSNYAFDGSVFDIYTALTNGAKLILISKETVAEVNQLSKVIKDKGVSVFFVTTALFNVLVDLEIDCFDEIRKVLFGGERVSVQHAKKALEYMGPGKILHVYGPTESTVYATYYEINHIDDEAVTVPIGSPLSNTQIYITDEYMNIQPVGVEGELCISGDGLARGYLNRPELTNEKFIDNPFADGGKLYKTGDLARWLPDGSIEFLGRKDHQVKIRGFRIELGEIENQLLGHEKVDEAIVIAKENIDGNKYLCGYITGEEEIDISEIKKYLAKDLPDYMIPSYIIQVEKMPLTPNGKIDRKALPEPDDKVTNVAVYEAPQNSREEALVAIWEEVLKVKGIGINHDFFELGGHSLKATAMVAKIHRLFNVEISLKEIFLAPTIKSISALIKASEEGSYSSIQPVEEKEFYPVSPAQKRLYTLQQFHKESTGYNMPGAVMLEGRLDIEKLEDTFGELIKRHEALRTSFKLEAGEAVQVIHKKVDFSLLHMEATEDQLKDMIKDFVKAFDLSKAPLLRVGLVRLSEAKHLLIFDLHHIISDGTSMGILIHEFAEIYGGETLEPLRIQYKDYSHWQQELMNSGKREEQKGYWLQQFKGEIPVLNILGDYPRPALQRFEGDRLNRRLEKGLTDKLRGICRETGSTMYMLLLAAYNLLLSKYSGQEDIIVGSPIAGRPHGDLNSIMGVFINTLAMRNYPVGEKTFREFLAEVKKTALEAYENQDYQFEELVENLDIRRDFSRNPLFDVMFTMQNMDMPSKEIQGLLIKPYNLNKPTSKFDMTLSAFEDEDTINIGIAYSTNLFKEERMEGLYRHLENILNQIAEDLDIKLLEVELTTKDEMPQLLEGFNNKRVEYQEKKNFHQLFEEQVARTPQHMAVLMGNDGLTYQALNEKANGLAKVLRDQGVKPNGIVGILGETSINTLIAVLAVIKAGGSYLPIDTEFPKARRDYMLKDSGAALLLAPRYLVEEVKVDFDGDVLAIEDVEKLSENLENINQPEDLIYTIYTSGTTGKGKGVMITHKNLNNYTNWFIQESKLKEGDRILLISSFAFDLGYTTLFSSLLAGGELHILQKEVYLQPEKLLSYIDDYKIDCMKLTPSHYRALVDANSFGQKLQSLRLLLLGGEEIKPIDVEKTYRIYKNLEIMNHYGPTETTIGTIAQKIQPHDLDEFMVTPTIGRPIANAKAYILDGFNRILPIGVAGELCISGDGVAAGYLNRPELTEEKFIHHPLLAGERMYKTGDLARWLGDGRIEFLGRIDHQVKIRGYRIELGEIETRLLKHTQIKGAVVMAREDDGGNKYLVGYFVADGELPIADIREYLGRDLPGYMIPSYIVQIEELPLTPNGKVDRRALPAPEGGINTGKEYEAPRNEVEEILASIWQEVLAVEKVGINDSFFELGGHSLKVTTMLAKIHKVLEVEVPFKEVFGNPTIKGIASYIQASERRLFSSIEAVEEKEYYRTSAAQRRLYTLQQFELDNTSYNMPRAVILEGNLDVEGLERAFKQLIERHESLRTSFKIIDEEPVQYINKEVTFKISTLEVNEDELQEIVKSFVKPFDLSQAPLLRVGLGKITQEKHLLIFDMHHIISDGVSMGILLKDFAELYKGEELESLKLQYKDYSEDQHKLFVSGKFEEEGKYWLQQFEGELPVLDLLGDYPRPSIKSFEGSRLSYQLEEGLTNGLRRICQETGTTMYMLLLSAFNVLLSKYTGQEDIIIGTPIAGRPHGDLSNIMGMFVNTLAMRNYPMREKTFKEFLEEVKNNALGAYENQNYQFEELVDQLNLKRDLSRNPLFDIMFSMQNMEITEIQLEDLTIMSYGVNNNISKFDMTLSALEKDCSIDIGIEYATRIFKQETIDRFFRHFKNTLEQIVENQETKLRSIQLATEEERQQILQVFNNTKCHYPRNKTLQQLFEEVVEQSPNKTAVAFGENTLTYRELNEKSNQLARFLMEEGVKTDTMVGIMVETSLEMIIGILAILKAGGVYVPIDPAYPVERINYMIQDSGCHLILTQKHLKEGTHLPGKQLIAIDTPDTYRGDKGNVSQCNKATDLAHVIYTSGSTGKPKGTLIQHRSVVRLVKNTNYIEFSEDDRILQAGAIVFDAITFEIWGALLNGLELHLVERETILDAEKLKGVIKEKQITILLLTVALFNQLVQQSVEVFAPCKHVLVGGDALTPKFINMLRNQYPSIQITNGYGPTENTTLSTCFKVDQEYIHHIPIGGPIANSTAYVLDGDHNLQPIGVVGELCLGGDGLARGYLNRPDLTAEKFIQHPFLEEERLYKTGDLVRWLPQGILEFIGRRDHQVKIRGFRIELGEIENKLSNHEDIKEAVVIPRESEDGSKYLCGYITVEKGIDPQEIKAYLAKELPEYMIPAFIGQLDQMPLTPNGKIDRRALPEPEGKLITGVEYVAPRNTTEENLLEIWREVLGVEGIGIDDHFFEIGGHSLKATSMMAKIHKKFDVEVQLGTIFKNPTIRGLAQYIDGLEESIYTTIEAIEKRDYYPLSSAQRRIYTLQQFNRENTSYNIPGAVMLEGKVDLGKLQETFRKIISRHETLRTSFEMREDEVVQVVQDTVDFNLEMLEGKVNNIEETLNQFVKPFDLSKAPLIRGGIYPLSPTESMLIFDTHHIISDGVSMGILMKEFAEIYNGNPLEPLRIQYKDYSEWQNQMKQSGKIQKQREYWLKVFQDEVPVLNLLGDHPRPAHQSFEGDRIKLELEEELTQSLKEVCRETGATLYMVLFTAYNILLAKYTSQEDIVIGSPIAGRFHGDLEGIIGMFVNTLAMRNYPRGEKTIGEFLREVKATALKAYENQELQLEELIESLELPRDLSRNPLFDVMFTMQNMDMEELPIQNLTFKPYKFQRKVSKFDLTLAAAETNDKIALNLEFNTNIFNHNTVKRLLHHYKNILQDMARNREIKLQEIELLSQEERQQILAVNNPVKANYSTHKTLHQIFEEQVKATPNHVALVLGEDRLTYRELNERANQLARILRNKGVQSDTLVGIMLDPSFEMVIGILAILKAGGGYLPISPQYPIDRINYTLEDSKAKFFVSKKELVKNLDFLGEVIDFNDELFGQQDKENLPNINSSRDIAYVIYTSGSTGKPKGVMVEHRNVVSLLINDGNLFDFNSSDVWTMFHSFCFDFSVWEMYGSLLYGGKLVLIPKLTAQNPQEFLKLIKKEKVTVLNQTPTAFSYLINEEIHCGDYGADGIRYIIFGGEALKPSMLKPWQRKYPNTKLINMYGITETTVHVTFKAITQRDMEDNISNIGRPIPSLHTYVMNQHRQLVPIGVPGELYVGGYGVTRGYLNREELTKEKFVEDPFCPSEILYKSGDLVRLLPTGDIEYLGRIDHQVKIRGFRIELGEIENRLLSHKDIREAIILTKEDQEGNQYLVGYITAEEEMDLQEIRKHLAEELPEYMIPSYILQLEKMPITSNGKIDRKALPEPDGNISTMMAYEAPQNRIEETLVELWQELLGIEGIGINHNFFELGGHSLKATTMVGKIHKVFNVEIALGEIFKNPTIKELGQVVQRAEEITYSSIPVAKEKEAYALSPAQRRLYALQQMDPTSLGYNMPAAMILEGNLDIDKVEESFTKLIQRHEVLRTSFKAEEGESLQYIHKHVDFRIQYMEAKQENVEKILKDFIRVFKLDEAPLLRVALVKIDDGKHLLILDMHHIISDGVSMGILVKEFAELYDGMELEPLKLQYKDYSEWQKELQHSGKMEEQKKYWLQRFEGEIPVLNLMGDYLRPTIQCFEGDRLAHSLEETLTTKLKKICNETDTTMYMLLMAAYNVLLSKYSGREDIVVGSPIAGRSHGDLNNIIGMFVNTLAIRNHPVGEKSFKEFLMEVKKNALGAYENQGYQFEELVENLKLKRDLSRNPLFDVMFSMQNMDTPTTRLKDIEVKPYSLEKTIAKFDMTITAREAGNTIAIGIEYATKIFKQETIARLYRHLEHILYQITTNLDVKLSDIQLVTEEEKQKILNDFNNQQLDYWRNKTIHQLFDEQVKKTPNNIAVRLEGETLTYHELNTEANQMAKLLVEQGVKPDGIVAIMMEPSPKLMVAIMGTLKAGGAYMPINPAYPQKRIDYMLQDSNAQILLTQKSLQEKSSFKGTVICVDDGDLYEGNNNVIEVDNLTSFNCATDLAYVIYTSGSTGMPKGVAVEHSSLNNFINGFYHQLDKEVGSTDKCLSLTSIAFDVNVAEIFLPITYGATLVFFKNEGILDINKLAKSIKEESITFTYIPPTILREVGELLLKDQEKVSLNKMLVGVEPIKDYTLEIFKRLNPNMKIINGYGPTEATICATFYEYGNEEPVGRNIPIGKPLPNTNIYIVDNNNLQPIGVAGEICIGGAGLARGYLQRPELTAEKFVDNPYSKGGRWYRTGDWGRWLPDGNIQFLGRLDHQVKIRGYRIELGEIETQIMNYQGIKETVVVPREDETGAQYLCSYIVADEEIEVMQLRKDLTTKLPEYMIPPYIIQIPQIPLTTNGKIDRKALPEPNGNILSMAEYEAPRNDIEELLVEIWQTILGVENIGIADNFFTLGGDSIKAIQVSARLNKHQLQLETKDILLNPVIKDLSKFVTKGVKEIDQSAVVGETELTPIQNWFFERNITNMHHWNQAVMIFSPKGFEEEVLKKVFLKIIEHHDQLRATFKKENGKIIQWIKGIDEENFHLSIHDFTKVEKVEESIQEEAYRQQRSIDLSSGPLFKITLFKTNAGDHLLMVLHHLVVDGVSWRIILEDLSIAYQQVISHQPILLQEKTNSYKEWGRELKGYGNSPQFIKEIAYWKKITSFIGSDLPKDLVVESDKVKDAVDLSITLSKEDTEKLLRQVNKAYHTEINDILLTAFGLAIKDWMGNNQVLINLEGHGRELVNGLNISRTVGWFTSIYPFILEVKDSENLGYQIKSIKEDLRRVPQKGIGYGILKHLTTNENKQGITFKGNPQISFNYLGQFDQDINTEIFEISTISTGGSINPDAERNFPLEVNGLIADGRLRLTFNYNGKEYKEDTIKRLGIYFSENLKKIIQHCICRENSDLTPSDTTAKKLDLKQFEEIFDQLEMAGIGKQQVMDVYSLSPTQRGLLYHAVADENSQAYFEQIAIRMDRNLDVELLEKAFNHLIAKYDVLRTVFIHRGLKEPMQVVLKEKYAKIHYEDITSMENWEKEKYIEDFKQLDRKKGFDLSKDIAIKIAAIKIEEDSYKIVWSFHHIIMDGWCVGIIIKDLFQNYEALASQKAISIEKVKPYSSFIKWLEMQNQEAGLDYWDNYLRHYERKAVIPFKKKSPKKGYDLGVEYFTITEDIVAQLKDKGKKLGVTLNTMIQTVWGILLQKYNGGDDVVFGSVVSGRTAEIEGIEEMVGIFINVIPVRMKFPHDQSIDEVLQQVQRNAIESSKYEYLPLVDIQSRSKLRGDLIDHVLIFENFPVEKEVETLRSKEEQLAFRDYELFEQTSYNFNIKVMPGDKIVIRLTYNKFYYDVKNIAEIENHFMSILEQIINQPECKTSDIDLVFEKGDNIMPVEVPLEQIECSVPYVVPNNVVQEEILNIFKEVLGISNMGIKDNFFSLGGDSIKALSAVSQLDERVTLADIFNYPTVEDLWKNTFEAKSVITARQELH